MGVLDFLGDLSKARTKDELGLGGMRSLLGTRGAAPDSKRGEEMMRRTSTDNLPGYFDPETREYVPWYVDLFDGGGLNKSEGLLASDAQKAPSAVDMLETNGAPVQRASQMAPGPLEPFGGAGPNIPEGPLGPFGGAGPRIAPQQAPAPAPQSAPAPAPFTPGKEDTPRLSEMQSPMMQHPAFPQFVDIMKRMGNESVLQNPEQASFVFNNYLKQIGYN